MYASVENAIPIPIPIPKPPPAPASGTGLLHTNHVTTKRYPCETPRIISEGSLVPVSFTHSMAMSSAGTAGILRALGRQHLSHRRLCLQHKQQFWLAIASPPKALLSTAPAKKLKKKMKPNRRRKPRYNQETADFSSQLNELARSSRPSGARQAQTLLDNLIQLIDRGKESKVALNTVLFTTVINGWSRRGSGNEAQALLDRLEERYEQNRRDDKLRPDAFIYNACILAWSRSRNPDSAKNAELLLRRMIDASVSPDSYSYANTINALARSKQKASGRRAEALLEEMEQAGLEPNNVVLSSVIHALSKSGEGGSSERAKKILDRMTVPDTVAYNSVLDALANDGAAKSADALLRKMEGLCKKARGDGGSSLRRNGGAGEKNICPNRISYTAVIAAWSNSEDENGAENAERVLMRMQALHDNRLLQDVRPDTVAFTASLNAWAKGRKTGSAERAERILDRMEELHRARSQYCKLSKTVCNVVANAYANSREKGSIEKAEGIIGRMVKLQEDGFPECAPDEITFRIVIRAWSRSKRKGYGQHVQRLHNRMKELGLN